METDKKRATMTMKKIMTLSMGGMMLLSSCGTATGTGAFVGGQFGHVIGSAIGAISGGWRGQHVGSLVGTVGGAVAGAAIGAAVDNAQQRTYEQAAAQRRERLRPYSDSNAGGQDYQQHSQQYGDDDSAFDPQGGGDDRIEFSGEGSAPGTYPPTTEATAGRHRTNHYSLAKLQTVATTDEAVASVNALASANRPLLKIRNARVEDNNRDRVLTRNEECRVSFEIMNTAGVDVFNVQPTVVELTGNKHVSISPALNVECIPVGTGIRYTATILADRRLTDGEVKIRIGVMVGNRELASQIQELTIPTRKKL